MTYINKMTRVLLLAFLICSVTASIAQTVTLADQTGEATSITGSETDVPILAFNLTRSSAADLTGVTISFSGSISGIFTNIRLYESSDAVFSAGGDTDLGSMSFVSGNDYTVTFTARPIGGGGGTNYFVVADVDPGILSSSSISVSVTSAQITSTGTEDGGPATGPTYDNSNINELTVDFTQNADDDTALADENDVSLLSFSANSNGTQSITSPIVLTFNTDISIILENFELLIDGANVAGSELYTLNGAGTQLTISAFNDIDVTSATTFELQADIKSTVTSSNDFTISLASTDLSTNQGFIESFGTFSNSIDISGLEATFTQNGDDDNALADQDNIELLDFTVDSNGSQSLIAPLVFTFDQDISGILENFDLRVGGADIPGSENYNLNVAGTQLTVTGFDPVDITNATTITLLADIQASATTADDFTLSIASGNITLSVGSVVAFNFSNFIDIVTSQLSDIIFSNGGTTNSINYRNFQNTSIGPGNTGSLSLADFTIRDGGGANDADNKPTVVTSITIQLDNFANVRQIALFDDDANSELAGTEQTVSSGTIVFTPSSPINVPDNGSFNLNIRASFQSVVTDNQQIHITITGVTAQNTGSGFASGNGGGATTTGLNTNAIDVDATKLSFQSNPPATPINTDFTLTVRAVDANPYNNIDLDYSGQVELTADGPGTLTAGPQSLTPNLSSGQFTWTQLRLDEANTYGLLCSDDDFADAISNAFGFVTITSSASSITQPSPLNLCYGGSFQALGNIVITETDGAGFSNSGSFSLGLPTGFTFDTNVSPVLSMSNSSTTFSSISYSGNNILEFSYSITSPTGLNALTISGLQIRYPGNTAPGDNAIRRIGGTATIAGVSPGTQLGTVNAALGTPPPSLGFTVAKVNANELDVNPNETRFSQSGNAVRLVGSPSGGVFTGPGVTFISGEYRFNPQSLSPSPPLYDITYTYSEGTGQNCQFTVTKQFEVYVTNITGLNSQYCNNDPASPPLSVSATYITNRYGVGYVFQKFVYWNTPTFSPVDITTPATNIFDPKEPVYQPVYSSTATYYGVIGIWIGFNVTNGISTFTEWQLIPVRPAPSVSFSIPKTSFCLDEAAVNLIGNPPNSNTTGDDFFSEDGPGNSISVSPTNPRVWSFDPSAVGTPANFNITYTYRDPSTGCSATSAPVVISVNSRPATVPTSAIISAGGVAPETCEGIPIGTFTADPAPGTTYRWYSDPGLTNIVGTGNSFTPPNPPANPNIAGTTNFYVTQTVAGCESNKQPVSPTPARELSVIVNPTPTQPVPNFNREYCAGEVINPNDLQISSGTFIKWYKGGATPVLTNVSSPNAMQIVNDLGINNTIPAIHTFQVTQTASGCEGIINPTIVTVTIKELPNVSITAESGRDPQKICTSLGDITFSAIDLNDPGNPASNGTWSGTGLGGGGILNPFPSLGQVILDPENLNSGNYTLQYDYTNSGGCSSNGNISLTILPTITIDISVGDVCNGSSAVIVNNSVINNGTGQNSVIQFAEWEFGDGSGLPLRNYTTVINTGGTTGTYSSPQHTYPNVGTFQIDGIFYTSDGCPYSFPNTIPVTVSPLPQAAFNWRNPCIDNTSGETTTRFMAIETSNPTIPITSYDWNFNLNGDLTYSNAGTGQNPIVNYNTTGTDTVRLILVSPANCRDTIQKPVYILPTYTAIDTDVNYTQNFESGTDGWVPAGFNSSWMLGVPSGQTITSSTATGAASWFTVQNAQSASAANQSSWVLSGCFDFRLSERPVISLDIWSDAPDGIDGAVLQLNKNGIIEDDTQWDVVGTQNAGINWYNDTGIANSPGNQTSTDIGWTGTYSDWRKAIFSLDDYVLNGGAGESSVIFRVAFASAQGRRDGFAFDNVFIGERTRIVLVENFTNASISDAGTNHNASFNTFGNSTEVVKLQFHTAFPGDDQLNILNPQMNNSRAGFYGITNAPTFRIDGDIANTPASAIQIYNNRVLTPATIEITTTATKVGTHIEIQSTITNKSTQLVPLTDLHFFTAIVEKSISDASMLGNSGNAEFRFVSKDILPSPSGIRITQDLAPGESIVLPVVLWEKRKLIDENNGAIVTFVQRITPQNKTVIQANIIDVDNTLIPDLITSLEDPTFTEKIFIYPNPANREVNVVLPERTLTPIALNLIDAHGRTVHTNGFATGEQEKILDTSELASGLYILQFNTQQGAVRKKVMVVHER